MNHFPTLVKYTSPFNFSIPTPKTLLPLPKIKLLPNPSGMLQDTSLKTRPILLILKGSHPVYLHHLFPVHGQAHAHIHQRFVGKDQIGRQWTIEPKDVADKRQVEQLYERIREQTSRLTQALETAGKGDTPVARSVQNLQNNVDFMNQMNHLYTYVQLPLKMLGNNAHGDLYVYTNKKNLAARDGQVSALLHLDMEHLGPLDVYVTMKEKQVSTNFTVADEYVLDLIGDNIEILNKRLEGRGYSLKAQMHVKEDAGEEEESTIMQTLLHQQKNISVLSRTSFDMRA